MDQTSQGDANVRNLLGCMGALVYDLRGKPHRFDAVHRHQHRPTDMMCVGWVDTARLTRESLTQTVDAAQSFFTIMPFASVRDCMTCADDSIDLIVYHAHRMNSVNLEDILTLVEARPETPMVVLSDAVILEPLVVRQILARGVSGLVLTNRSSIQLLVSALTLVASGGTFIPREVFVDEQQAAQIAIAQQPLSGQLTQRELDVLTLVKEGKPNKLIAHSLHMSPATVKVHIRHMMRKMGVTNRTEAAMNAERYLAASPPIMHGGPCAAARSVEPASALPAGEPVYASLASTARETVGKVSREAAR